MNDASNPPTAAPLVRPASGGGDERDAGELLRHDIAPALQLAGIAVAVTLLSLGASRAMLDAHPEPESAEAHFAWPRGALLLIGLLIFAGMVAEGVMYDWSVLYLKQELGLPQSQAGLGFAAFSLAMALSRFGGDALRARYPERLLLRSGATLATLAMLLLLLLRPAVALVGNLCVGAGLALVVPSSTTRRPGCRASAAKRPSRRSRPSATRACSSARRSSASSPTLARSAPRWAWW